MNMCKRERNKVLIIVMLVLAFLMLLPAVFFAYRYYSLSKPEYVKLSENSSVDYSVCLSKNKFYEDKCISKNNQYIASLIDYIPAKLNYDFKFLGKNVNFKYLYKIKAKFDVIDKDNKGTLFTKSEILYESDYINASNEAVINYDLDIDYNKYNELLSSFITIYDLDETINTLNISMDVNIYNDGNLYMDDIAKESVINLSIPLTRKTINIDMNETKNISNTNVPVKSSNNIEINLVTSGIFTLASLVLVIYVIYYYMHTRTILEIYQGRIRKIITTYDSYIQRITGNYPIGACQICKVASFRDMLEIKDSSDKPLLMLENEAKTGTFFIIPIGEGVIYTYALRVEDIMAEQDGTKAPDYNIEDINVDVEEVKPKKYTKEKIKEDIEKTISLNIIDDENAIKGTKNSDEDLYEQLEKTATFKAIKDNYYFPEKKVKAKRKTSKNKKTNTKKK